MSAYIQLTARCNMACKHCCFACTSRGTDMTEETFRAALDFLLDNDQLSGVTLGGGEPTLHPQFWQFLGIAQSYSRHMEGECGIGMVTNGKRTEDALALAALARKGVLRVALSQDQWHDRIDEKVVRAFTRSDTYHNRDVNDLREIRTVSNIVNHGRAKKNSLATDFRKGTCNYEGLFVAPDGVLYSCGCKRRAMGTVFAPDIPEGVDLYELECGSLPITKKLAEEPEDLVLV